MSFETAAKRMSADVLSFAAGSSSVKKGESLRDTVETIEAIGIDSVIIRHASSGVPARVAGWVDHCAVINAGDGWHQHPTQALLDLYTVRQALGRGRRRALARFEGLQVAIVGDIRHSRVARSQIAAYAALGAEVTLVAPATPAAALAGGVAGRRRQPPPRRRAAQGRRGLAAAGAVRAGERGVRPHPPRVHGRLRTHRPSGGHAPARGAVILHPGPDRPRRRDRLRGGRAAGLPHHRAGQQRGGRPDGRAVPAARPGALDGAGRD